jgi:hypothetical protein
MVKTLCQARTPVRRSVGRPQTWRASLRTPSAMRGYAHPEARTALAGVGTNRRLDVVIGMKDVASTAVHSEQNVSAFPPRASIQQLVVAPHLFPREMPLK